jgi:hypothetical protein
VQRQNVGTLTKRPRTVRPMDFSSQKFCNKTSLGQNGPWDKAVLGKNILGKFATKRPHFQGWTGKKYFLQFCFSKICFPIKITICDEKRLRFLGVNLNLYGSKRVKYFCIFFTSIHDFCGQDLSNKNYSSCPGPEIFC